MSDEVPLDDPPQHSLVLTDSPGRATDKACATLTLRGELDLSSRAVLLDAAQAFVEYCTARRAVTSPDNGDAVLDVTRLHFIDASSLAILVGLQRSLAAAGIGLHTHAAHGLVRRVSGICGLDTVLGLEPPPPTLPTAAAPAAPSWPATRWAQPVSLFEGTAT